MQGVAIAVLLLAAARTASAGVVEELVQLPSADGARLPVLLSHDDDRPPQAVAVLFSGGDGKVGLVHHLPPRSGNFLVRTRTLFAQSGVATAVVDVPTDLSGMSDAYRMSSRHAEDVRSVVAEVHQRFAGLPVFLVGTSRGTVSAAYAGAALGSAVAGVVVSSTVFNATRGGPGVSRFDWDSIPSRLLFVHHVDDACIATPYAMARRVTAKRTLVSVRGGDAPRSDPCEALSAHGFLGVEAPVVRAIVQWMRGEPAPAEVP